MKLVIIDNYDSFTFNLLQMLGEVLGERPIVFKNDEVGPREIEACAPGGVVLSPGPGHPRDAGRLIEIVRDLDPNIPVLGVCLGHQAIVEAEGGTVLGAGVIVHGKTSEVTHDGGVLFEGVPTPFDATRYHSLVAERASLPATLRENARTLDGLIMAVEHTTRPMFGVQFHPESLATGVGSTILRNFAELCRLRSNSPRPATSDGSIIPVLERVLAGVTLSRDVARSIGERILRGQLTPAQIGALSIALRTKGESAEEVAGFALALHNSMTHVRSKRRVINITGTGADGCGTFNISTAASFVIAGAGVAVAKTVGGAKGSMCGSEDVARALGVPLTLGPERHVELLDEIGLAFFPARESCSGLRYVPDVSEIGTRTVFGLVASLVNAADAKRHLIGVSSDLARNAMIRALKTLGAERALVVHATDGMDEITASGISRASELLENGRIVERTINAQELGLSNHPPEDYAGGDAITNAQVIVDVLEGKRDGKRAAHRDVIAINAAAGLLVGGVVGDLATGLIRAFESIDSWAARSALEKLREANREGGRKS